MRLDGQSRVDGQHFEKERELPVESVLDLWPQATWEICNPLSKRPLGYPVVFDESVAFGMSTHPKLERAENKDAMIRDSFCFLLLTVLKDAVTDLYNEMHIYIYV